MAQSKLKKNVSMCNSLIKASHGLTLTEKRLVMLASTMITSPDSTKIQPITIKASDYAEQYNTTSNNSYVDIRNAAQKLESRYISFYHEKDGSEAITRMRWVGRATYVKNSGQIEIVFWPELTPYLTELKRQFTSYNLARASKFKSIYTWRIFELTMQFKKTGLVRIASDDFRKALELKGTYEKDFGAIRRKVIEPAIKEIKEKDGLPIEYVAKKTGRRVTSLEFTFPVEQQKTIEFNQPKPKKKSKKQQAMEDKKVEHLRILSEIEGAKALAADGKRSIEAFLNSEQLEVYQKLNT